MSVPDDVILNKQMAPKVVTLHTIYDHYVSKNLKREPAIVAKLNHPIIASLEGRGRLCRQLLLMPGRRRERIERFKLQEEMSRWLFNFHHHFYDDDWNGEMSMKMIVMMKEVFQLKCKKENQCLLRLESLLLASSPHPAQDLVFKGPGICQIEFE